MNLKACVAWACVAAAALVMGCSSSGSSGPPLGNPVALGQDGTWQWVPIDGAVCRDGSPAGFAINPESNSNHVMIFLEGGGACFDAASCTINPASIIAQFPPSVGIFDRTNANNPVADWNFVYVPYCTGDVHAGDAPNTTVAGVSGVQQFVGYANMKLFLSRIVPTFPSAEQVLFTGVSAGGFGAASDAALAQNYFRNVPVVLLDDSGPPMSSTYIAPCLQQEWRETWDFDKTVLAECGSDCPDPNDYILDLAKHLITKYPNNVGGLISHIQDGTISFFYGFGLNNCQYNVVPTALSGTTFQMGLEDFQTYIDSQTSNFGTYFINGNTAGLLPTDHTCLTNFPGPCYYTADSSNVALTDWIANLLNGTVSNVAP